MKYTIGLDIGTASIGWAVIDLEKKRIHDVGVRIFERPEDPKSGKSLAEPRRIARGTRRRLKRRKQRLNFLKTFFAKHSLLNPEEVKAILNSHAQYDPYEIRTRALEQKITPEELFVALYHIAKRRGYKSNRKSLDQKDPEGSRVLSALSENAALLKTYSSVASALQSNEKFAAHRRNKRDSYQNSFARNDFLEEAKKIITIQRAKGLALSDAAVDEMLFDDEHRGEYSGIFSQRPFMTDILIKKMRGKCELEPSEYRAPKASYSFELFRIAQNLSHLRVVIDRQIRGLTAEEISVIIKKAHSVKTISYSSIRDALGYKKDKNFAFAPGAIKGKIKPDDESGGEKNNFDKMSFYHSIKAAFKDSDNEWQRIGDDIELLDSLGEVLTVNKDDTSLKKALEPYGFKKESVDHLLALNFSGFCHLSSVALRKITPYLREGANYDEAVVSAGYVFNQKLSGDKTKLPSLSKAESQQITNPVVKRAVAQSIKMINALIRKYGPPTSIHLEAAGDLAKNFQERGKIKKMQDENATNNETLKELLVNDFNVTLPTGLQITKFKLYNQQNGVCIYSGRQLDLPRLFGDERYGEIDHIIPFSRCGNDSLANKVLVLTEENQNKGNLIPYEAWGSDVSRWESYEARVRALSLPFSKKERLLAKTAPAEEWNSRALNDTRYISKFLRQYIRSNLKFAESDGNNGLQRVITPTGAITSYLRRIWRVGSKSREENNLHHAADACIIASISQGTIQQISSLNKYYELFAHTDKTEVIDRTSGEVIQRGNLEQHSIDTQPFGREDFGKEVRLRTALYKTPSDLRNELRGVTNYDASFIEQVTPIFVSRMPKRSGTGALHKDTIRSPKIVQGYENNKGEPTIARKQRIALTNLRLEDLKDSPTRETDPMLYETLKQRLEENGNDPKKAFVEPVYKPTKTGNRGNIVRGIKIYDTLNAKSGILINKGQAFVNNGAMARIDIYQKTNAKGKIEHFVVPVYTHQLAREKKGEKITKIMPSPKGFSDIDDSFTKITSLYTNDYVRFYFSNRIEEGYYVGYNVANGSITIMPHSAADKGKGNVLRVSARSAIEIQRLDISLLGDNYNWI